MARLTTRHRDPRRARGRARRKRERVRFRDQQRFQLIDLLASLGAKEPDIPWGLKRCRLHQE